MKKGIWALALLAAACMALVLTSWPSRWVLFHGWKAANHASRLLAGNPASDNSFIDYTIYTASGCVVFATNEDDRTMVYCPNGNPTDAAQIGSLAHVVGPWYRGK